VPTGALSLFQDARTPPSTPQRRRPPTPRKPSRRSSRPSAASAARSTGTVRGSRGPRKTVSFATDTRGGLSSPPVRVLTGTQPRISKSEVLMLSPGSGVDGLVPKAKGTYGDGYEGGQENLEESASTAGKRHTHRSRKEVCHARMSHMVDPRSNSAVPQDHSVLSPAPRAPTPLSSPDPLNIISPRHPDEPRSPPMSPSTPPGWDRLLARVITPPNGSSTDELRLIPRPRVRFINPEKAESVRWESVNRTGGKSPLVLPGPGLRT
jgi:hypothetical protein